MQAAVDSDASTALVQANYGVPATRKRLIVMGALPEIKLPSAPEQLRTIGHDDGHACSKSLPPAYTTRQVSNVWSPLPWIR